MQFPPNGDGGVLKAISNRTSAEPLILMLDFAQRFSLAIDWTSFARVEADLKAAKALMDSTEAEDRGIRLRLPGRDAR